MISFSNSSRSRSDLRTMRRSPLPLERMCAAGWAKIPEPSSSICAETARKAARARESSSAKEALMAAAELAQQERIYRQIVEESNDIILAVTQKGEFTLAPQ